MASISTIARGRSATKTLFSHLITPCLGGRFVLCLVFASNRINFTFVNGSYQSSAILIFRPCFGVTTLYDIVLILAKASAHICRILFINLPLAALHCTSQDIEFISTDSIRSNCSSYWLRGILSFDFLSQKRSHFSSGICVTPTQCKHRPFTISRH